MKAWILLVCLPFLASAHKLQFNQPLPPVSVSDRGELILDGERLGERIWGVNELPGKVRVIQHIAGRGGAKELNAPLIEAIKAAGLPRDRYQTVTIINVDDAVFGTAPFVRGSAEGSKQEFPWSSIVLDEQGRVAQQWQLQPKNSAIIVLDREGLVRFAKEGALSPQEVEQVLIQVRQALVQ
ncbi:YtfJ family protein [Zobellella endophytica]|uniref:YtfJ family protein n=1 Tax=Zobellella endophytica TaxID=2116700 RepID=A0A2P7QWS6_9GAMM|nr:YtfJ family protein [Zobellella endophytica]PSJ42395.1 YtfJ family protein [Zobellella endophytica]